MNVPTEIICVLLGALLAVAGGVLTLVVKIDRRLTRIETALEVQGLLEPKDE